MASTNGTPRRPAKSRKWFPRRFDSQQSSSRHSTVEQLVLKIAKTSEKFDEESFKALKAMCKRSPTNLKQCHEAVCKQLCRTTANRKLNMVRLLSEFGHRSAVFRQWTLEYMDDIIDEAIVKPLAVKNNKTAQQLCTLTAEMFLQYRDRFEDCRARITFMENHLKRVRNIDLSALRVSSALEIKSESKELIDTVAIKELLRDTDFLCRQIEEALRCMFPGLDELIPDARPINQSSTKTICEPMDDEEDNEDDFVEVPEIPNEVDMRLHGFNSRSQLVVNVRELADRDVASALTDLYFEAVKSYMPRLSQHSKEVAINTELGCALNSTVERMRKLLDECERTKCLEERLCRK